MEADQEEAGVELVCVAAVMLLLRTENTEETHFFVNFTGSDIKMLQT